MLYSPRQSQKDQLLSDILAVRERLSEPCKWTKGNFHSGDRLCIVAACQSVTGHAYGFARLSADALTENDLRFGRLILFIHEALFGPEKSVGISLGDAQKAIANANDSPKMTHEAVLLLLDRAIQRVVDA